MRKDESTLSPDEVAAATERRLQAAHLQAIEDCPPTAEQTAMFEMFEREAWSHERRLAFIRAQAKVVATMHAAE